LPHQPIELRAAPPGPAHRALDGALLLGRRRVDGSAVVQTHHDVAAQLELHLDRALRGQRDALAGGRLAKDDLIWPDDSGSRVLANERIDLKPAGIAYHRARPAHETMDPAGFFDQPRAGRAQQM